MSSELTLIGAWSPDQARDEQGRWTDGVGAIHYSGLGGHFSVKQVYQTDVHEVRAHGDDGLRIVREYRDSYMAHAHAVHAAKGLRLAEGITFVGAEFDDEKHPRDEHGRWTVTVSHVGGEKDYKLSEKVSALADDENFVWDHDLLPSLEGPRPAGFSASENARKSGAAKRLNELAKKHGVTEGFAVELGSHLGLATVSRAHVDDKDYPDFLKAAKDYLAGDGLSTKQERTLGKWLGFPAASTTKYLDRKSKWDKGRDLMLVGAASADPSPYRLSKFAAQHAAELVDAPKKERDAIRNEVRKALKNGEGPDGIATRLFGEIDKTPEEIQRIAQTEYVIARTGAKLEQLDTEAGDDADAGKQWVLGDAEHCPTCIALAGQVVPLGEPFVTDDGEEFDGPPAHPNCDCDVEEADLSKTRARAAIELIGA